MIKALNRPFCRHAVPRPFNMIAPEYGDAMPPGLIYINFLDINYVIIIELSSCSTTKPKMGIRLRSGINCTR